MLLYICIYYSWWSVLEYYINIVNTNTTTTTNTSLWENPVFGFQIIHYEIHLKPNQIIDKNVNNKSKKNSITSSSLILRKR